MKEKKEVHVDILFLCLSFLIGLQAWHSQVKIVCTIQEELHELLFDTYIFGCFT